MSAAAAVFTFPPLGDCGGGHKNDSARPRTEDAYADVFPGGRGGVVDGSNGDVGRSRGDGVPVVVVFDERVLQRKRRAAFFGYNAVGMDADKLHVYRDGASRREGFFDEFDYLFHYMDFLSFKG